MKPKKIPRPIQAYFFLFGLFMGQLIGMACFLLAVNLWGVGTFPFVWCIATLGLYAFWAIIGYRYRRELADWGIIEGEKKTATTN